MTFCGHHSDKLTTPSSWRHVLEAKRVGLSILNFGGDAVDTRSATGRLMLNMFAAMAQFERENHA
jgi:DNA invertase Pin-like site-specific DNA recombinase